LQYRHPDFVDKGRFLGADKLLVTESDSGRIVIHYFGDQPHEKLFATPIDNIVGTDTPIEPFHKGTCVGVNFKDNANMSDGRSVVWKETEGKTEIRLPGPKSALITLGNDATCVQFSNDWSRMLVVKDNGIIIYHFPGVLDTGTLAGNEIGEVPVKNATSAFFVGNGMIVVSNFTNRVLLWRQVPTNKTWVSSEIYKGDNEIRYAEPDGVADRIILIENLGLGAVHGFLYSVAARETWLDLGSEYKRLGASFTSDFNVAVAHFTNWTQIYPMPTLGAWVEKADRKLSPECRPPNPGDYRRSPCWPASYQ
jgi:hypothetical protein